MNRKMVGVLGMKKKKKGSGFGFDNDFDDEASRNRRQIQRKNRAMLAACPVCDFDVTVDARASVGQRVVCPKCNKRLEIVWLDPVELDVA